jgi:hypothetical protein
MAVPELSKLLRQPEAALRTQAAIALWRINRDTNVAPVLTAELERVGHVFSYDILTALGEMGPAAKSAVPVIVKKLEDPKVNSRGGAPNLAALEALKKIDRTAAANFQRTQEEARTAAYIRQMREEMRLLKRARESSSRRDESAGTGVLREGGRTGASLSPDQRRPILPHAGLPEAQPQRAVLD